MLLTERGSPRARAKIKKGRWREYIAGRSILAQDVDPGGASRVRMGRGEQISWTLPSGAVAELKMNLGLESAWEKERKTGRAARQPCPLR